MVDLSLLKKEAMVHNLKKKKGEGVWFISVAVGLGISCLHRVILLCTV